MNYTKEQLDKVKEILNILKKSQKDEGAVFSDIQILADEQGEIFIKYTAANNHDYATEYDTVFLRIDRKGIKTVLNYNMPEKQLNEMFKYLNPFNNE